MYLFEDILSENNNTLIVVKDAKYGIHYILSKSYDVKANIDQLFDSNGTYYCFIGSSIYSIISESKSIIKELK